MSIFSRTRDIFAANMTELLDRSEDPAKMIRMIILEMEETLVEVRASAARCIADAKEMRRALSRLDELQKSWTEKAELALSKEREDLAKVYAAADVFVFPSKTDTFGLVLLEAMACGLPVAAYPVTGPRDVIGESKAGVLHEDLRIACLEALKLRREDALARAKLFTWRAATEQFFGHLHPRKRATGVAAFA